MEIKECCVSFEIAEILFNKGFDEQCLYSYKKLYDGTIELTVSNKNNTELAHFNEHSDAFSCTAPLKDMVHKWLRDKHGWYINVFLCEDGADDADGNIVDSWQYWSFNITPCTNIQSIYNEYVDSLEPQQYQSYEEAEEVALKYCLENLVEENQDDEDEIAELEQTNKERVEYMLKSVCPYCLEVDCDLCGADVLKCPI